MNCKFIYLIVICACIVGCCDVSVRDDSEVMEVMEVKGSRIIYVDNSSSSSSSSSNSTNVNEVIGTMEKPILTLEQLNDVALYPGDQVLLKRGTIYRGQLFPKSGNAGADIVYGAYGEGEQPLILGSIEANNEEDWRIEQDHIYKFTHETQKDIGNIIFNNGESFGVKKWLINDIEKNGDYFFDQETKKLYIYMDENPATKYKDIECAVTQHIIDESKVSYVTYENLELKYGGAHGIGGGNVSHITIRNMTISYIGGGFLYMEGDKYIQFGNGIEFWSYATDILVEDCKIFEIFDSGVTNQNNTRKANQERITYRNNYLYNCGMASFEIDNGPARGNTADILFEYNRCENVGKGWGMTQDRYLKSEYNRGLGHHVIMFYMETPLENLIIENNIFIDAYHPDGYGSIFLFVDISDKNFNEISYKKNEFGGDYDSFGYRVQNGVIRTMENER